MDRIDGAGNIREVISKERIITAVWSDRNGDWSYTMTLFHNYDNGERLRFNEYSGDSEWAKRQANHYSILMPKVEE